MSSVGAGLSHWLRTHPATRMVLALIITLIATSVVLMIAAVVMLKQRDVDLPDQLRTRLLADVNAMTAPLQITTDRVSLTLSDEYQPVLTLQSVKVADQNATQIVAVDYAVTEASLAALFLGELKLQRLSVEGVQVPISRSETGQVGLVLQPDVGTDAETAGAFDVAKTLETVLTLPELDEFKTLEIFGITIEYDDALTNKTYVVDGARATLDRTGDALQVFSDFALITGGANVATVEMTYATTLGQAAGDYGVSIDQLPAQVVAGQAPFLSWLAALDAPISGSIRGGWDDNFAITPTSATLEIGSGRVKPTEGTRPVVFDGAKAYLTYDPATQMMVLDQVRVDSRDLQLSASGYLKATISEGVAEDFEGHIDIVDLAANPLGSLIEPFKSQNGHVDFRLSLDPFQIEVAEAYIRELDEGSDGYANGIITARPEGWELRVNAFTPRVGLRKALSAWPIDFKAKPRKWIDDHISAGALVDYEFSLHRLPNELPVIHYSMGFEDLVMAPFADAPPIQGLSGHLSSHDFILSLETDAGYIETPTGRVDVAGSRYTIPNSLIKPSLAEVNLQIDGAYEDVLWVLNHPPVSLSKRVPANLDLTTGRVIGTVDMSFLLSKTEAAKSLKYSAAGRMYNARSKFDVLSNQITSDALDITIDDLMFTLSGPAEFGGMQSEMRFVTSLDLKRDIRPRLNVNLRVSDRDLTGLGVTLPRDLLRGTAAAELVVDFPKGAAPQYRITSDMVGFGARIPILGWRKSTDAKGQLRLDGQLGETPKIDGISYSGQGLEAEADVIVSDGAYAGVNLTKLRVGDWFNTSLSIGKNGGLSITSGTVILADFLDRRQSGTGSGTSTEIALDRLIIDPKNSVTNFRASLNQNGLGPFSGAINGAPIAGRLYATSLGPGVEVVSTDAAGVLMATDVVKRATGGSLKMELTPTSRKGELDGTIAIRDIRVQNSSFLLEILNAISIVGLLDQLRGAGMSLDEVDVKFRNTPEQVVIESATAFGPSVGISVDGYFFKQLGQLDLQGVISPIYALNAVGALLSGKGQGLIGFNFTIRGETDKPRVVVNPLSAFTPSLFREIFRRPAPNLAK